MTPPAKPPTSLRRVAPVLLLVALAACRTDPFVLGTGGHWDRPDAGATGDAQPLDACATPGATEICDGVDNDCDGLVDEDFDLQSDPRNCGACGRICELPHADARCEGGACALGSCQPGFWDLDGDPSNGCEYPCFETHGGVEACDHLDNDCDGLVDEDFDLLSDPNHCGACDADCASRVGEGQDVTGCVGGICQFACRPGRVDLDGDGAVGALGTGCEYACEPQGLETCDGTDNDCDGLIDEDDNGSPLTAPCYSGPPGSAGVGLCTAGTRQCIQGVLGACVGERTPEPERCDGADNDCDGLVDEDFDLQSDPEHCGDCGRSCWQLAPPNAYPVSCAAGQCQFACNQGFGDADGDLQTPGGNGCERSCPVVPPSPEVCDGVDNDCDGLVDEGLTPPNGFCYQGIDGTGPNPPGSPENNPCRGVTPTCVDPDGTGPLPVGWYCAFPPSVSVDPTNPNVIIAQESSCDGLDNDCDGVPDDDFGVGDVCYAGVGGCRRAGARVCAPSGDAAVCDAVPGAPESERCDGVDNDCDGEVDEVDPTDPGFSSYGVFVYVASGDFTIFAYEASRPSADATDEGFDDGGVPCSVPGVMPWSGLTAVDAPPLGDVTAQAACQRLGPGWDLCTREQWYEACAGGAYPSGGEAFPYGASYDPAACNGYDYGAAQGAVQPLPTGSLSTCARQHGGAPVLDLSGNLKEWVRAGTDFELRGGAYNNLSAGGAAPALQCDGVSPLEPGTEVHLPSVGFRCCYSGNLFQ